MATAHRLLENTPMPGKRRGMLRSLRSKAVQRVRAAWTRFWMQYADLSRSGRFAARMVSLTAPRFYGATALAEMNPRGYISPSATVCHSDLRLGQRIFVGDRVVLYQCREGGPIILEDRVRVHLDSILQTEFGGSIVIGQGTHVHPRCILSASKASIRIGAGVQIAANCAFYPYDHGMAPGRPIMDQPVQSKGDIVIEDGAWLGTGVIVLSGVRIGKGAVIAAGAVVSRDIPDDGVAMGVPARVLKQRGQAATQERHQTVLVRAVDGTIWFWSRGAEQMYGWRPEETVGQTSHRLLQTVFPAPLEHIDMELQHRGYWEGTLIHTRRDGMQVVVTSRWELLGGISGQTHPVVEINREMSETVSR
jgi:acetyltransferase-like isoleucine patch superfamily enzyme